MIIISRALAKRLRIVFSRGLGITARDTGSAIEFQASNQGLTIRTKNDQIAIEYHAPGEHPPHHFAAPFEVLRRCEGSKNDTAALTVRDNMIAAEWTDAGIPQSARFDCAVLDEFPPLPERMTANGPELLDALRDAVETADKEAARYALHHLRLRGGDGQIAATDGRQLLVQTGFAFPWEDELLIPANRLLASGDLLGGPVEAARTDDWVTLRSGPWTLWLRINKDGRFPNVDDHLPQAGSTTATLHVSQADAEFLAKAVKRLPASEALNSPVTVDLNGAVAIRAKSADESQPTEVVLSNSRRAGDMIRFCTNREYLARAMRLGFRSLDIQSQEAPACCRDDKRAYVWALLAKTGALNPNPDAMRIESPAATSPAPPPKPLKPARIDNTMPQSQTKQSRQPEAGNERQSVKELLEFAEAVKTSLRDTLAQTNTLIVGLKKHRHQSQRLRSAMLSLRQLQAIDA